MSWLMGAVRGLGGCEVRPYLITEQGMRTLHAGDALDIQDLGRWVRGRIEFSPSKGWYWTNDQFNRTLDTRLQGRVWDSIFWPQREDDRPGRGR